MNWQEYALELAEVAAKKSKDPWRQVGACLLRHDNTVAGIGYNGFPSGMDEDWTDRDKRRRYVIHAEQNAMRYVKPGECALIAITLLPCNDCLKTIASYGIKTVVFRQVYERDQTTLELANDFGITLIQLMRPVMSSYWDHSVRPSQFVVKMNGKEIHRGCYRAGEKILGISK
jgi:dCMP deaminase